MPIKVLILGGGLQGISCARSLKESGHVVAMITSRHDYASKSTALSKSFLFDRKIELPDLEKILSEHHFDVILPMSDSMTFLLAENKESLQSKYGVKCAVPDLDVINIAGDKTKLMEFCRTNGIPHPRTVNLKNGFPDTFVWPALLKPERSVGARGIVKVKSVDDVREKYPITKAKYGECQLQEFIDNPGPYFNVMLYRSKEGKILGHAILKIIRYYPISGGSSSMCQTINDYDLLKICSDVLEKLDYVGFADFDVLQTKDGDCKIIEINPRVPASLRGAAISGINFPDIIVSDNLGLPPRKYEYEPGKTLRYLGLDILWFLKSNKRFSSSPSWFRFFGKDTYYQEGGWKDRRAMMASLWSNISKVEFKNGKIKKKEEL